MTGTDWGDWSNHDEARAGGVFDYASVAADGVSGGFHKSTDGLYFYTDPYFAQAAARMRDVFSFSGAYHVLWGNRDVAGQVDWWASVLDQTAPWWRDDPTFALMTDNEPFSYNVAPTVDQVNAAGDRAWSCYRKQMFAYCPPWHYGADLARLRYPLVSSNYGANPAVHYPDAYPGDGSPRWAAGGYPDAWRRQSLQYGSLTVMGSETDCDADRYRGDLAYLIKMITGGDVTDLSAVSRLGISYAQMLEDLWVWTALQASNDRGPRGDDRFRFVNPLFLLQDRVSADRTAALAPLVAADSATKTAVDGLAQLVQAGGGTVDGAALAALGQKIDDAAAAESQAVAVLNAQNADLHTLVGQLQAQLLAAENARLAAEARLAAAVRAEADALNPPATQ